MISVIANVQKKSAESAHRTISAKENPPDETDHNSEVESHTTKKYAAFVSQGCFSFIHTPKQQISTQGHGVDI